jgi:hypothetical protein
MAISVRLSMRLAQAALPSIMLVLFCLLATNAEAQVGPPSPPEKQESGMSKAIGRLLKKDKESKAAAADGSSDNNSDSAAKGEPDVQNEPDPDAKPFFPSNGPGPSNQVAPSHKKKPKKKLRNFDSSSTKSDTTQSKPTSVNAFGQPSTATPMGGAIDQAPERPPLLTQPPLGNANIETPQIDTAHPPILTHPKLDDPHNPLGFRDSEVKLKRYIDLVSAHRYAEARPGVLALKQFLTDITEAHIGLYKTLTQIPSARGQAELEKELALQFAQLRDRAIVESARIHIADKDYFHAVKELTDVVKSQPRTRLGVHSYELLQEMGFTEKLQLTQD